MNNSRKIKRVYGIRYRKSTRNTKKEPKKEQNDDPMTYPAQKELIRPRIEINQQN